LIDDERKQMKKLVSALMWAIAKRPQNMAKRLAAWTLLTILCLFGGCVASHFSAFVTVGKDYADEATVGVVSYRGFPVWYYEAADGMRGHLHDGRANVNWCAWTAVFMLICYGLRFAFAERKNIKKPASSCKCEENTKNERDER